jgi:hypothetical protein
MKDDASTVSLPSSYCGASGLERGRKAKIGIGLSDRAGP